ncbi:hypothetical protein [Phaffia rhodozyma]|uniref:Uncharacterized protein n=1 Tax=Phaffia rhodozyma TaxID=264483 RepID=A0A0F7SYS8_PHARH|nr:hypothetical protein [Phaffia rhodozyma]
MGSWEEREARRGEGTKEGRAPGERGAVGLGYVAVHGFNRPRAGRLDGRAAWLQGGVAT